MSDPRHIIVEGDGRILAEAVLHTDVERRVVAANLHVQPGHLPMGTRTRLVDAVLDECDAPPGTHLQVTLPIGDFEILDRMRERCTEVQTRAAGASVLLDGEIPPA
jgi:hypothetical protein